jgi:pyridoxamine 5'-phosphate oxidase
MKYKNLREEYRQFELRDEDVLHNPFAQFEQWFDDALNHNPKDTNAMVLSTVSKDGWPQGRVVLLKEVDHGFVWFTNYESGKGQDLEHSPKASLTFWWPGLARQVRVTGNVEKVSKKESDDYFQSRPRNSQAGAIASQQSSRIDGRDGLENRYAALIAMNETAIFQRPENWGGYRLTPHSFEFWQGRESRLHDRILFTESGNSTWKNERLSP